jgi:hypothetical protein
MRRKVIFFITGFTIALILNAALPLSCVYPHDEAVDISSCNDSLLKVRPHPAIGNYNVYYGSFHSHSAFSDGSGTPEQAFSYAKCVAGVDFFGLSDHDFSQTDGKWRYEKETADFYNSDGVFATFCGFEWTSNTYGHVTVVNTEDFTTYSDPQTNTLQGLCSWLSTRNCFAIFNHPGSYFSNTEFENFLGPVCEKIMGMELWNKVYPFSVFYYNDGYNPNDGLKGFYDEALSDGWKIGAAGGFDDHNATWGTAADYRVAVLAKSLSRQDIFAAMKARRFYSTLDKNIAISFTMAGREMGSTITSGASDLEIRATDGDGEIFSEVVLFDKSHEMRRIWNTNGPSVAIIDTLITASGDYYYVKIKQDDGDEAISSAIWVSDSTQEDSR